MIQTLLLTSIGLLHVINGDTLLAPNSQTASSTVYHYMDRPTGWGNPVSYINIGGPGLVAHNWVQLTVKSTYDSVKTITGIQVTSINRPFTIEYSQDPVCTSTTAREDLNNGDSAVWTQLGGEWTANSGTCCSASAVDTIPIQTFATPIQALCTRMSWARTDNNRENLINAQFIGSDIAPVDECAAGTDNCDINAICTDTRFSYECECMPGFSGDGTAGNCIDIDECALDPNACDTTTSTCANQQGGDPGYICVCNTGYEDNGSGSCVNRDECTDGSHSCSAFATCQDIQGSYDCECFSGYRDESTGKYGEICVEIDECNEGSHDCDENAICENTMGSYECACNGGYEGDGTADNCECSITLCDVVGKLGELMSADSPGIDYYVYNGNYLLMGVLCTNIVIILFFIASCFIYFSSKRTSAYSKVKQYEQSDSEN